MRYGYTAGAVLPVVSCWQYRCEVAGRVTGSCVQVARPGKVCVALSLLLLLFTVPVTVAWFIAHFESQGGSLGLHWHMPSQAAGPAVVLICCCTSSVELYCC